MNSIKDGSTRISSFAARVSSVGGHFLEAMDLSVARDYVLNLAKTSLSSRIVVYGNHLSTKLFPKGMPSFPLEISTREKMSREEFFERLKTADIGISPVDLAIAETGTLIISTTDEADRLVTALPRIHVAVLPRSRLVETVSDGERFISSLLKESRRGVAVSLISAPSTTSDIGDMVIMGVHGPKELHVLLLDGELDGED